MDRVNEIKENNNQGEITKVVMEKKRYAESSKSLSNCNV